MPQIAQQDYIVIDIPVGSSFDDASIAETIFPILREKEKNDTLKDVILRDTETGEWTRILSVEHNNLGILARVFYVAYGSLFPLEDQ